MTNNPATIPVPQRGIFCNRTLNLRSIRAIGYDQDYTLIHYRVDQWENTAFKHLKGRLAEKNLPVDGLEYDRSLVMRGLIIDLELGNLVKANRFGFTKQAAHGTRMMDFTSQRKTYARTVIDLSSPRFGFLNTLFSLSEGCMFAQLVDRLDRHELPAGMGYADLYRLIRRTVDETHMEGKLKAEILETPERFVMLDPEIPRALMDQKAAGRKLLLITNSDWVYTAPVMSYAFDRFLPDGMSWRDLFDLVIVSARKPAFFDSNLPIFELVNEEGLLQPVTGKLKDGGLYLGGCATQVEEHFRLDGEQILYIGDHVFSDVHASKSILRWRTGLVVRELEDELEGLEKFKTQRNELAKKMELKEQLEFELNQVRLQQLRQSSGHTDTESIPDNELNVRKNEYKDRIEALDQEIAPLADQSNHLMHHRWGLLMRAGNDKSHFARQVEKNADIYMSRVSNLLHLTPFAYLRSPYSSLPHDMGY